MARRATKVDEKPARGEDAANGIEVDAGFSTERLEWSAASRSSSAG